MIFTHNKTSPLLAPSVSDKKIIMLISNYGISFCCIPEVLWQAFHRHGPTSKRHWSSCTCIWMYINIKEANVEGATSKCNCCFLSWRPWWPSEAPLQLMHDANHWTQLNERDKLCFFGIPAYPPPQKKKIFHDNNYYHACLYPYLFLS